jgi:deazaflavin-dependent oxidoreductase (nitroreductase family)
MFASVTDTVTHRSDPIGDELAEWGKVVILETRGRTTGTPTTAAVGYVEQADGSLLVSASDDRTHWARNIAVDPVVRVTREGRSGAYRATALEGVERNAAITALILTYGTPAERLGAGPAFRLVPLEERPKQP